MKVQSKVCRGCEEDKPLYEYNRCKTTTDRLLGICKECVKTRRNPTDIEIMRKTMPETPWNRRRFF